MVGHRSALGCLIAAGLLLGGCQGDSASPASDKKTEKAPVATSQDIGDTLATVNGMAVGTKEFDEAYARSVPRRGANGAEEDGAEKKQEVIDKLISDKLLYQEALRQGLDQDPRIQKMMVNSLLRKDVYGSIKTSDISEEELKAYFEEHRDEFVVPEKVQVRRILIKVDDDTPDADAKAKAAGLKTQIEGGAEFKDLAMEHSEDPYARRGGDIGFISDKGKPGLDQAVVDKAFATNKGQISDVFLTDEGYNLVQVVNRRDRIERTFDQMKGAVLRKVKTEKYKQLYDDYVAKLRTTSTVSVDDAKLKSHEISQPTGVGPALPGSRLKSSMPGREGGAAALQPPGAPQ